MFFDLHNLQMYYTNHIPRATAYNRLSLLGTTPTLRAFPARPTCWGRPTATPPTDNGLLQAQGVNVLTVLTTCKANYLD